MEAGSIFSIPGRWDTYNYQLQKRCVIVASRNMFARVSSTTICGRKLSGWSFWTRLVEALRLRIFCPKHAWAKLSRFLLGEIWNVYPLCTTCKSLFWNSFLRSWTHAHAPFPCMWCNVMFKPGSIAFSIILGNSPWKHYSTSNLAAIDSFYPGIFIAISAPSTSLHRGLMPSKILKLLIRRCLDCMASMVHWMWFPGLTDVVKEKA